MHTLRATRQCLNRRRKRRKRRQHFVHFGRSLYSSIVLTKSRTGNLFRDNRENAVDVRAEGLFGPFVTNVVAVNPVSPATFCQLQFVLPRRKETFFLELFHAAREHFDVVNASIRRYV